jgi:hypothetical protein
VVAAVTAAFFSIPDRPSLFSRRGFKVGDVECPEFEVRQIVQPAPYELRIRQGH